jgi:hypothetical protein
MMSDDYPRARLTLRMQSVDILTIRMTEAEARTLRFLVDRAKTRLDLTDSQLPAFVLAAILHETNAHDPESS